MGKEFLKRYTDLPSLIHMLRTKNLTLLNPSTWEDKNDASYMQIYKDKKKLSSLLALCFTEAPETSHHWKVFASGSSGVCVQFDKSLLLEMIGKPKGIRHRSVEYRKVDDLEKENPALNDLPFLKRFPFSDEKEYRIIYEDSKNKFKVKEVPLDISCISRITLSPWLPKALVGEVKSTINSFDGLTKTKIFRTTLNENNRWQKVGNNVL